LECRGKIGDGNDGWQEKAPLTARVRLPRASAAALVRALMKPGGGWLIPVGGGDPVSEARHQASRGRYRTAQRVPVSFVTRVPGK